MFLHMLLWGVPARLTRFRFSEDVVDRLSKIKWSDWNDETIKKHIGLFYDPVLFLKESEKSDE